MIEYSNKLKENTASNSCLLLCWRNGIAMNICVLSANLLPRKCLCQ
jgi:hypothetical protein